MTDLPRAKYSEAGPNGDLIAVYSAKVRVEAVAHVVRGVAKIVGVKAGAARRLHPRATIVWMRITAIRNKPPALRQFRRLTRPELPIAIVRMGASVLVCQCGRLSLGMTDMQFMEGFRPADDRRFELGYRTALRGVPLERFPREEGQIVLAARKALEQVLISLKAHATVIDVVYSQDRRRCTHQG